MITIKTKDQKGEENTGRGELNNVKLTNETNVIMIPSSTSFVRCILDLSLLHLNF